MEPGAAVQVYEGKSHFGLVDLGSELYADLEQWTLDRIAGTPRETLGPLGADG